MFKTFAFAAAALVAVAPSASFASNNNNSGTQLGSGAELIWNGQISRSCSISATDEGTVALTADEKHLQSDDIGTPAELTYSTTGGKKDTFTIKSTESSVTLDGDEVLKGNDAKQRVEVQYEGSNDYQDVYQGNQAVSLDNQKGRTISGSGTLDVNVRTNAHLDNDEVQYGTYVVRTTVVCLVK